MVVTYKVRNGKHRPSLDFAHVRCGEMQKRDRQGGERAEKIAESTSRKKIGGANGFYGLSRPIPQICVVLITIRPHHWLLVKLWG